ncbi:tRNA lysidine(34) synthetase TilS [Neisseria yangbaofengii]|uniref:tRNA lysidine(34) synthetase TilS n=1 Tax=Neisseria yangbaofengii TaxID=2709396 RepID=UPI0013EA9CB5|nr:tRNA lysidine(34) synthetase TilS [Neisseria yangbaofengii]
MDLLALLAAELPQPSNELSIEIGLSGGLDSVVLLHLLARFREQKNFKLNAVHIHHGLSPLADEWVDFCRTLCAQSNVDLRVAKVAIKGKGKGIEAAARAERYRVFSDGLCDILALAHHQNDQIETFMLGVARGGGMRSLAAMPKWRDLNQSIKIWRPLLDIPRAALENYALEHHLAYVSDESNQDTGYLRNWIRHEALPQWQRQVSNIHRQILSNVRSMQDDLALLDEVTQDDYRRILSDGLFQVKQWRSLSELRRRRVLHHFFQVHQIRLPSHKTLSDMVRVLLEAESAQWQFDDKIIDFYRDILYVRAIHTENYPWLRHEGIQGRLKDILLENGFILKPHRFGLSEQVLMDAGTVRKVTNSDVIKLELGHKSTKKILQECHILPSVRQIWPVITNADGICLAVVNLKANQDFRASDGFLPIYEPLTKYITELNPAKNVIR